MKFKSAEEEVTETPVIESPKDFNESCDLCKALDILTSQVDLLSSMLCSIQNSIETIRNLHAIHNSR